MGFLKEVCYNPSEFDIDVEENNCCVSNETGYIAFTYCQLLPPKGGSLARQYRVKTCYVT